MHPISQPEKDAELKKPQPAPAAEAGMPHEERCVANAEAWLAGIDAGDYAKSWNAAAGFFQKAVTEAGWADAMTTFRKPMGEMKSRKSLTTKSAHSLPGAPDGEYVVMQFTTSFSGKAEAVETVTFMKEPDGSWKAAGYLIR